jgi:peroxiredoxin
MKFEMKNLSSRFWLTAIAVLALFAAGLVAPGAAAARRAQTPQAQPPLPEFRPALIEQPMPDFTLPSYQTGDVSLSQFRGKNVMIIFSRGYAAPNYWCTICNYRYVELAELEKAQQIRKKYNVEVLFVFPYDRGTVTTWLEDLPGQLEKIREAKNPADVSKLDEAGKRRMERWRQFFPKDFSLAKGQVLAPFPVLIDADRMLSKRLGLFQTEWSGSKVDQNMPSVYIIDKNGIMLFKYIGQNTLDRPSYDYLFKVLEVINSLK